MTTNSKPLCRAACARATVFIVTAVLSALPSGSVALAQDRLHVNAAADPGGDGFTWGTAFQHLQDALAAAQPGSGVTEIWVAAGTYRPDENEATPTGTGDRSATFQLINGVAIYGGFPNTGDPLFTDRDPAIHETILSGDLDSDDLPNFGNRDDNSYHVLTAAMTDGTAVLDGLTIRAGNAAASEPDGGGLLITGGSPTVRNCTFRDNSAQANGGAVSGTGSPMLSDCDFIGNAALFGGAVDHSTGNLSLLRCDFLQNRLFPGNQSSSGGAIRVLSASRLDVVTCTFVENAAGDPPALNCGTVGGAINAGSVSAISIVNSTFTANRAGHAGAIYAAQISELEVLNNCTFADNWLLR